MATAKLHSAYSESVSPLANADIVSVGELIDRMRIFFRIEFWPTVQFYSTV